jgi:hypothetical protein
VIRTLARHAPQLAEAADRMFSLDDAVRLRSLSEGAGFQNVETTTELQQVARPSFAAYFEPARSSVRELVRRGLGDTGGPIEIDCEIRLASGSH